MTTTTPIDSDLQQQDDHESHGHGHGEHPDLRMFGLATFLVADGMTFAGFFAAYLTYRACLLYTSPSPRDQRGSRMPSSA